MKTEIKVLRQVVEQEIMNSGFYPETSFKFKWKKDIVILNETKMFKVDDEFQRELRIRYKSFSNLFKKEISELKDLLLTIFGETYSEDISKNELINILDKNSRYANYKLKFQDEIAKEISVNGVELYFQLEGKEYFIYLIEEINPSEL